MNTPTCPGCRKNPSPPDALYCAACDRKLELSVEKRNPTPRCARCRVEITHARQRTNRYCGECANTDGRLAAQGFNQSARGRHPSQWIAGQGTEEQRRQALIWLGQNTAVMLALTNDNSQLRLRCTKYGITVAEWIFRVVAQDGRCGICKKGDNPIGLVVDHDHVTGEVRGLLCQDCNVGIGWLRIDGDNALPQARATLAYVESFIAFRAGKFEIELQSESMQVDPDNACIARSAPDTVALRAVSLSEHTGSTRDG